MRLRLPSAGKQLIFLYQLTTFLCLLMTALSLWMWGRNRLLHDHGMHLDQRNLMPPSHLLPSAVWSSLVPLQLHDGVRKYHPILYRRIGYAVTASSLLMAVGLIRHNLLSENSLLEVLPPSTISVEPFLALELVYFASTAVYALYLARNKQVEAYENWMIRHVACGLFVGLYRILLAMVAGLLYKQNDNFGRTWFLGFLIYILIGEYVIQLLRIQRQQEQQQSTIPNETTGISFSKLRQHIQQQTEITIAPLSGRSFHMIVNGDDQISQLKKDLALLTRKPAHMQDLIFQNKRLHDGKTLRDYGITRGAVIHQRLKMKGGGSKGGPARKSAPSRFNSDAKKLPQAAPKTSLQTAIHQSDAIKDKTNSPAKQILPTPRRALSTSRPPSKNAQFTSMKRISWVFLIFFVIFVPLLRNFQVIFTKGSTLLDMSFEIQRTMQFDAPFKLLSPHNNKTTVAYAVSVTGYKEGSTTLLARAAVLHQSIKLAMAQSARYDFHIYAFVHPDAAPVADTFRQLGYRVQIRDTPFNLTDVPNQEFVQTQKNGCCGAKEYLKLYSWLLLDYPAVIHLDLDTLVLRPMDDLFDILADPNYDRSNFQNSSMWTNMTEYKGAVDFLFTRDYYMIHPPSHQPHQIGVQGGFLALRPNADIFAKFVDTIVHHNTFERSRWGGKALGYGKYYGAATIQGLASYFYGHLEPNRSVELNRCYYNTMVDDPYDFNEGLNATLCTTVEPNLTCQDCRETAFEDIYTTHFTEPCGKPEKCKLEHETPLCMKLFAAWHKVRLSLEQEWGAKYKNYVPNQVEVIDTSLSMRKQKTLVLLQGHCSGSGSKSYLPLRFPPGYGVDN